MPRWLRLRRGPVVALLATVPVWPLAVPALMQTDNDRTPTWTTFSVRQLGQKEEGAFFGLGAMCQFPEQFAPKRPNPRWETERPSRPHFVEHLNPGFSGCVFKPYLALPQFMDRHVPAELRFEFGRSLPSGFKPFASGERTAIMRSNLAESVGRRFKLPDLSDAEDQSVRVSFSVWGKELTDIRFRIDRGYRLDFHGYDRSADDRPPHLIRRWAAP